MIFLILSAVAKLVEMIEKKINRKAIMIGIPKLDQSFLRIAFMTSSAKQSFYLGGLNLVISPAFTRKDFFEPDLFRLS
jgi:hypothetical protein